MALKSKIVAQFRHPIGILGALAGRIMAARQSNRVRNHRTVDLMTLSPESRVLEIGCGPGLALAKCASVVSSGWLVGLDHSDVMIRQARNRLRKQGDADKVALVVGGIDRLAEWPESFDRIFSLNVIQFQEDKIAFFSAVYHALAAGGLCLTTYQPRLDVDGKGASRRLIASIEEALHATGFAHVSRIEIIGGENPAICVLGRKAGSAEVTAFGSAAWRQDRAGDRGEAPASPEPGQHMEAADAGRRILDRLGREKSSMKPKRDSP